MKVSNLFSTSAREWNTLSAIIDSCILKTNKKYAAFPQSQIGRDNFSPDNEYFGLGGSVFFVMWALTNQIPVLDISSLYHGDVEVSKKLKARIRKKPEAPTEVDVMIDCLTNELFPTYEKYGATKFALSKSAHHTEIGADFIPISEFDAREAFKEFIDGEGTVFFHIHLEFPAGVRLHHDPEVAEKIRRTLELGSGV